MAGSLEAATPVGAQTIERTANVLRVEGDDVHVALDRAAAKRTESEARQARSWSSTVTGRAGPRGLHPRRDRVLAAPLPSPY